MVGAVQFNKLKTFFTAIIDATPQDERADARDTAALAYASNGLFTGADFDGSRRPSKSMRSSIFSGDLSAAAAAMQSGVRSVKKKTVGVKTKSVVFMDMIAGASARSLSHASPLSSPWTSLGGA